MSAATRALAGAVDTQHRTENLTDMLQAGGVKLDTGKARFDLLPPDALAAVAGVYTFGAEKYAARNWELGMDWGRVYAATQRHLNAMWSGENLDPETGMLHAAHASFGTLTLTAFQLRGVGLDSRGIVPAKSPVERKPFANLVTGGVLDGQACVTLSEADFDMLMREAGRAP